MGNDKRSIRQNSIRCRASTVTVEVDVVVLYGIVRVLVEALVR